MDWLYWYRENKWTFIMGERINVLVTVGSIYNFGTVLNLEN